MRIRSHAAASYVDNATMLHMGHAWSFKIPGAIRHFCLRACPHMRGPGTWTHQPCCVAASLQQVYDVMTRKDYKQIFFMKED